MKHADLPERGPLRPMVAALEGGLRAGEIGLVQARAGTGKTALLMQLALDRLLHGEQVLHVARVGTIEHVRDGYDSQLTGITGALKPVDRVEARLTVERHRVVHIARDGVTPATVGRVLDTLAAVMDFAPSLVVIDGWEPGAAEVAELGSLAREGRFAVWCACVPEQEPTAAGWTFVVELVPDRTHVWLHARQARDGAPPFAPIRLDAAVFTAREAEEEPGAPDGPLTPGDCTQYSGGAAGAEAAFGVAAERWGVHEVNFTFYGHAQARTRGAHPLTEQELAAGDVSLAYVSRKLRRGYGERTMIRRVLQSLWHQVSHAQQVFVIGAIQEDGTVTGGTGWSVELARMWGKQLWVYDQDKSAWFRWNGDDWVQGTPVIEARTWCGTGTRYLQPNGQRAIEDLLERSFG